MVFIFFLNLHDNINAIFTKALQGKIYMVIFIMSHYKHRVSLQHNVILSIDIIEGTN